MFHEKIWSRFLLWRKNNHKHVLVTKKLVSYIDTLIEKTSEASVKKMFQETKLMPYSHLQTDLSEARFISVLTDAIGAKKVLELGTFRGFLSVQVALMLKEKGVVVTCDSRKELLETARKFATDAGVLDSMVFKHGEAQVICSELLDKKELFDLIFIDADKMNYERYIDCAYSLIRDGGVIVIDNTLWASLVAYESGDKIVRAMQRVNETVFERFGGHAAIIPAWDGVTMFVVHK